MKPIETTVKLTSKNQTTIPSAVRKALALGPKDEMTFVIDGNRVEVHKSAADPEDRVVGAFLKFLEQDLISNPAKLSVLERDPVLAEKIRKVQLDPAWD